MSVRQQGRGKSTCGLRRGSPTTLHCFRVSSLDRGEQSEEEMASMLPYLMLISESGLYTETDLGICTEQGTCLFTFWGELEIQK